MKKLLILFFVLAVISCSAFNKNKPFEIQNNQGINTVDSLKEMLNHSQEIIYLKELEIDSLYNNIDKLKDSINFLNSAVRIKKHLDFPDSIIFANFTFDLTNDRIKQKFIYWYKAELKFAYRYIPRTTKYFPLIEKILSKNNLPEDLKYLAVAESYLNPLACSPVGAEGYWQFMKSTAKYYDIRINHFVDQRRDIFTSTQAACEYILWAKRSLLDMGIDDLLLAMCSFNAGMGNIKKAIREQGGKDFFNLIQRKNETDEYIWRTIVLKYIIENENKIFVKPFKKEKNILESTRRVNLTLKGYYKIDKWALAQGTVVKKVWELNPWIKIYRRKRYKYSPVNDVVLSPGTYTVLLPKNSLADEDQVTLIEKQFLSKNEGYFVEHIVKKGENLYLISKRYNTSVENLMRINNLKSYLIFPGQCLRLFSNESASRFYIVKKGDYLAGIAQKLGVSTQYLVKKNNLKVINKNNNPVVYIYPNQKLYY